MNEIQYLGEHLWVGQLGHICILLSFVSALLSAASYYFGVQHRLDQHAFLWNKIGRFAFFTHFATLLVLMFLIFYAMYHQMYEYSYIFDHVSGDLPMKYILSAFWAGQEGSFMLWMFWHGILASIIIAKKSTLEAPVMCVIALAEVILMSMLLGIHIPFGDDFIKIGSNPTTLLRHINEAPIFNNADYLSLIKGRGLNPLLQNYWMTIHPPTLFLGFASTIVPFAYAFAGLWLNEHKTWMKEVFPWALFSTGILGTGILMGSLWAYVALTFGGYWAWDPVENASLVPWITLVAGVHVHLVSKNTGYATRSTYFFYLISFVLILYSSFLTRSGVLGDTSAHAFTEMGLEWQLVFLVCFFLFLGIGFLIYRFKDIYQPSTEEALVSREFWMFIGSLILLFSAVLITASTSLPVFNKIIGYFDPSYEGKVIKNVIGHYNKYQMWIAVFVAILSSMALIFRYGGKNWAQKKKSLLLRSSIMVGISALLAFLSAFWLDYPSWQFYVLSFSGMLAMLVNLDYAFNVVKGNLKLAYSAISHFGFGMMIIGILASGLNQKAISTNPFVFKGIFNDEDVKKYVQLIKGKPLFSQGYLITYQSDTLIDRERHYDILFEKLNDSMKVVESFTLHPNALYSNDYSKIAAYNPSTKHYLTKDIFTSVVAVPPSLESAEKAKSIEDSIKFVSFAKPLNDTIHTADYVISPLTIRFEPENLEYKKHAHDGGIGVLFSIYDKKADTTSYQEAAIGMEGALMYNYPANLEQSGLRIKLDQAVIEDFFTAESELIYQEFTIKSGEAIDIFGKKMKLTGFDKDPKHDNYEKKEGDIAVGAQLEIMDGDKVYVSNPIYVIRDQVPMSIKQYLGSLGWHIRFSNIDPTKESFSFKIAKDQRKVGDVKFLIASDVPRTDYIILQATIFPGINLFWVGSVLMMFGLFLAAWYRFVANKNEK